MKVKIRATEILVSKNVYSRKSHLKDVLMYLFPPLQETIFLYHRWWNHNVCKLFFSPLSEGKVTLRYDQRLLTYNFKVHVRHDYLLFSTKLQRQVNMLYNSRYPNKQSTSAQPAMAGGGDWGYTHLCYFNRVMRTTISWFFLFSCLWRLLI